MFNSDSNTEKHYHYTLRVKSHENWWIIVLNVIIMNAEPECQLVNWNYDYELATPWFHAIDSD